MPTTRDRSAETVCLSGAETPHHACPTFRYFPDSPAPCLHQLPRVAAPLARTSQTNYDHSDRALRHRHVRRQTLGESCCRLGATLLLAENGPTVPCEPTGLGRYAAGQFASRGQGGLPSAGLASLRVT